ncbi:MAG: hypothetical protein ABJ275_05850 [Maricaulaceae bacterium]
MLTTTHTLMAFAALSKTENIKQNWAIFIGSLIPDAFIYLAWAWLTFFKGESQRRIWDEIYFDAPIQFMSSVFNSTPIYATLALLGYIFRKALWAKTMIGFSLAALIHIAFDLPFHNDDAHAHFWPITDWRFFSPLSYWDPNHHSHIVSIVEVLISFGLIFILWKRFPKKWVQGTLLVLILLYAARIIKGFAG